MRASSCNSPSHGEFAVASWPDGHGCLLLRILWVFVSEQTIMIDANEEALRERFDTFRIDSGWLIFPSIHDCGDTVKSVDDFCAFGTFETTSLKLL
jgi:hypothetical protein